MSYIRDGARVAVSYEHTDAAIMLRDALERCRKERGLSQRKVARELGYKTSVALSHMSLGRIPIPVERADELANFLGIRRRAFIFAVLDQRYPEIGVHELCGQAAPGQAIQTSPDYIHDLETIAERPLDRLPPDQARVVEEALQDQGASRRWLAVREIPALELLRRLVPNLSRDGLSGRQKEGLILALSSSNADFKDR